MFGQSICNEIKDTIGKNTVVALISKRSHNKMWSTYLAAIQVKPTRVDEALIIKWLIEGGPRGYVAAGIVQVKT